MKPIKIMTDSLSDIPKEFVKEYDISVLPLTIRFKDEEFKDRIDLSSEEFFHKLQKCEQLPTTSQVPPSEFMREMKKALDNGFEVIVINGSSGVSGTHQSAMMAKNELHTDDITVIDSLALSYTCGLIVVEAAKMAKEGRKKEEILKKIEAMKSKTGHIFSVETLEYLKKGGRLSAARAAIGTVLNVKPILTITDGKVEPLDKVRGSKKIIPKMIELAKESGLKQGCQYVCVAHGANIEGVEKLKEEMIKAFAPKQLVTTEVGCTIGTYTGPGLLAILYVKEE